MKILIYYPKTQKTITVECEQIEAGPGGISWTRRGECGFFGYCADWVITVCAK
jgi:hypothetical protein